jgi:ribosomal protein S2
MFKNSSGKEFISPVSKIMTAKWTGGMVCNYENLSANPRPTKKTDKQTNKEKNEKSSLYKQFSFPCLLSIMR